MSIHRVQGTLWNDKDDILESVEAVIEIKGFGIRNPHVGCNVDRMKGDLLKFTALEAPEQAARVMIILDESVAGGRERASTPRTPVRGHYPNGGCRECPSAIQQLTSRLSKARSDDIALPHLIGSRCSRGFLSPSKRQQPAITLLHPSSHLPRHIAVLLAHLHREQPFSFIELSPLPGDIDE